MKILFPLIFLLLIYLPTNTEGAISMFRNVDLTQSGTQLHPDTTLGDRSNPAQNCRMTVGDLDGDNKIEFVFNDGQRVIQAFDDDGTRLWSYFDSSARTEEELYHNFTIQVYDIDLDGKDEVIAFKIISSNQHVVVINGETGANQATLQLDFGLPTGFFDHHHIAIANTRGTAFAQDIVAMYSSLLKIEVIQYASDVLTKRWYYVTDTDGYASGHWAHPYDIDGDGKDEILSRDVLDDDGTRLGILPMRDISGGMDHPDSIVVADIDPTNEGVEIALACQTGLHLFSNNINTTPDPDEFIELWTCEQSEGGCVPEPQETTVGNFRTDVSGLEIVFFAEGMSGTNSVRMYKYDETILKSGNQASTGPKRLITHNMDWDGDRSVDEIYSRNGIWNFNFAKISESMNWSWVNSIDTDEWPPVITDIRETTDHREEILFYDMDEIVIIQNSDTLGIDSEPSPWTDAGYRFKMANTNHGNHYYFNWLTLYSPNPRRGNVILSGVKDEKILFAIYIFAFLFPVMYFRHR